MNSNVPMSDVQTTATLTAAFKEFQQTTAERTLVYFVA